MEHLLLLLLLLATSVIAQSVIEEVQYESLDRPDCCFLLGE